MKKNKKIPPIPRGVNV